MDGRGILGLGAFLLMATAGCQHQVMTVPRPAPSSTGENAPHPVDRNQVKKASAKFKDLPPSVLVSSGDFKAGEAFGADIQSARQQHIRELAQADYENALKLDPKYLPAYQGLARLYTAMREHGRAAETYQKALRIDPKNAALWYELGMCHNYQKNWSPALECLSKATQLDPENRSYVNAMGIVLAESGRYEDSLNCFVRSSGDSMGYYRLAQTLQRLQQPELSRRYMELALQKDPNLATTMAFQSGDDGTAKPAKRARPAVQQTAYQAPPPPPAPPVPDPAPAAMPRVIQLDAEASASRPAKKQVILPPPPAVNVQYDQPNP